MKQLSRYVEMAWTLGITKAKIIDPRSVVTGRWVRLKCQYGCGGYGSNLACPPFSPTPEYTEKVLHEYSKALLMQIEKITRAKESRIFRKFKKSIVEIERKAFLDGYYKAYGMSVGPCSFCRTCNIAKRCKHPYLVRPSMEASGIDVYQTARNNGFTLEVVKTKHSLCSYIALLLIR